MTDVSVHDGFSPGLPAEARDSDRVSPSIVDMRDVYIGRQPIFDRDLKVQYYELLYRSSRVDWAEFEDGDEATSQLLNNSMIEIGLDRIASSRPVFINLTRSFVTGRIPLPLDQQRVGLEILDEVGVDEEVIDSVRRFSEQGFTISLDDFIFQPHLRPLLRYADIVKLDVQRLGRSGVLDQLALLRNFDVTLLAQKIESKPDFEFYRKLGFDYFQGYFIAKPSLIAGKQLAVNRVHTLRLLAEVENPAVSVKGLEDIIRNDVVLSVKLLRYINSAFFGLVRKFESIREAVIYLGLKPLKVWVSLIILSRMEDQPAELMRIALIRAKMAEALADMLGEQSVEKFFTMGLFSTLDTLMDMSMKDVVDSLPLNEEVAEALVNRGGAAGELLTCVLDQERGTWRPEGYFDLSPADVRQCYFDAIAWCDEASKFMVSA